MKLKTLRTALLPTALAAAIMLVGCSTDNSGFGGSSDLSMGEAGLEVGVLIKE